MTSARSTFGSVVRNAFAAAAAKDKETLLVLEPRKEDESNSWSRVSQLRSTASHTPHKCATTKSNANSLGVCNALTLPSSTSSVKANNSVVGASQTDAAAAAARAISK